MRPRSISALLLLGFVCFPTLSPAQAAGDVHDPIAEQLLHTMKQYRAQDKPLPGYPVVFRRDPMRSLIDEQGQVTGPRGLYNGLAVQGIIRSKDMRLTLVNDEFFKEGDWVGPYKILKIQPEGLLTQLEGKDLFIPFYPETQSGELRPADSEQGSAPPLPS